MLFLICPFSSSLLGKSSVSKRLFPPVSQLYKIERHSLNANKRGNAQMCEARPSAAELTHEQEARILEIKARHRDERVSCAGNMSKVSVTVSGPRPGTKRCRGQQREAKENVCTAERGNNQYRASTAPARVQREAKRRGNMHELCIRVGGAECSSMKPREGQQKPRQQG